MGVIRYNESLAEKRWLIILTIMILAILEVLDSTIVNVALRPMMPALGANQNQITWVLTSYVVASAIILPLTGFLTSRLGRKNFLILCATGFMMSSFLCGISTSLVEMVVFRIFQGLFGSSLIPISQAILRETFSRAEQGKAMAIWGLGIMTAPVCGPTLGGYITEHASWRWVFYINLPFCLIGILLLILVIKNTERIKAKIDILGLVLMVVGIASLQIFLDKGNENDWFSSNIILSLAVISAYCIVYFLIRTYHQKNPLIDFSLYKDRNFRVSCITMLFFSSLIFSFIALVPILLERIFEYTALNAGLAMASLGISSGIAMILMSNIMRRVDVRWVLSIAAVFCASGAWCYANMTTSADFIYFTEGNALLGFGMGCFMVPLSTYALITIPSNSYVEGSGLFSYARMLGTSIGISLFSTYVSRETQKSWNHLSGDINAFNPSLRAWLHAQHADHLTGTTAEKLGALLNTQSSMLGFIHTFQLISFCFLLLIPLIWRLKLVKFPKGK